MEKLLWIDLEMTGLEVEREVIIECAAIVTDLNFATVDSYHAVVKQPQSYLDGMDDWNKRHHGNSGLTALIPNGKDPGVVEKELMALCKKHFPSDGAVLAGNSISQDRLFITKYWPELNKQLHYRMLDVSSWKIILKSKYNVAYDKKGAHRALDDIQESINELKYYLSFIKTDVNN